MIRIASYNIRKAVGLDWRRDPLRVARAIARLDADILALQEADKRLGSRPSAMPPEALYATGMTALSVDDGPSIGVHGNAILVRNGLAARVAHGIHLPGLEPRGALLAEIDTALGPLLFCATHLGLARRSRQKQLQRIVAEIGARHDRAVIAGDMNEWSRVAGFAPLDRFDLLCPGPSFHAARPVACLDRIALGSHWRCERAGVFHDASALRASDHLPVWADIGRA